MKEATLNRRGELTLKHWKTYIVIALCLLLFTACSNDESQKQEVKLYASSSLSNMLTNIEKELEDEFQIKLILHLRTSAQLIEDVKDEGPFDLFLTPSQADIDELLNSGHLSEDSVQQFTYNDIVCINYYNDAGVNCDFDNLDERVRFISVADPEAVTLGSYTKDLLINKNLWNDWEEQEQLIFAESAPKAFDQVNGGDAEIGFVYGSDARFYQYPYVEMDEQLTIPYTLAISEEAKDNEKVLELKEWFLSEKGQEVLEEYGFITE